MTNVRSVNNSNFDISPIPATKKNLVSSGLFRCKATPLRITEGNPVSATQRGLLIRFDGEFFLSFFRVKMNALERIVCNDLISFFLKQFYQVVRTKIMTTSYDHEINAWTGF